MTLTDYATALALLVIIIFFVATLIIRWRARGAARQRIKRRLQMLRTR